MAGITGREIYVVSGMGRDVTGLVSLVTSIISDTNGNIIDMEENVFHGLFSIFLTIDLTGATISGDRFIAQLQAVAHQSGLQILAERQSFTPRLRPKQLMRLLLIGADHPGIVSSATFVLANNGVNIEGARMISRGDLFAMEMDIDRASSPRSVAAICKSVSDEMERVGIRCFFQTEDTYRKHARLLVFTLDRSLLDEGLHRELLGEAGASSAGKGKAAAALAGIRVDMVKSLTAGLRFTSETEDLLHALKLMGCLVALISNGYDLFLEPLREQACIDHLRCNRLLAAKGKLTGKIESVTEDESQRRALIAEIACAEQVAGENIVIIGSSPPADLVLGDPGIRVFLDKSGILSSLAKKFITPAQIPGIVSAFGSSR